MKRFNWNRICSKLFPLPIWVEAVAFAGCGAALVGIFLNGQETWFPAYFLYVMSATALCMKPPRDIRGAKQWMAQENAGSI